MSRAQLRELGHEKFYDALFDGLQELGYVEGRNLIVPRVCGGDGSTECRLIVVTTHTALAVKKATTTIPIMHPNAIDPLNTGLICQPCAPRWESYGRRGS